MYMPRPVTPPSSVKDLRPSSELQFGMSSIAVEKASPTSPLTMAQRVALRRQDSARTREARRKMPLMDLYPPNMTPEAIKERQLASQRRREAKASDTLSARDARRRQEEERDLLRQRAAAERAAALRGETAARAKLDIAAAEEARAVAELRAAQELRALQEANAAAQEKLYDQADTDGDGKLDFTEFCDFVRKQEATQEFTEAELRARFDKLDDDGSGNIDMAEYLAMVKAEAEADKAAAVGRMFGKPGMSGTTLEDALQASELSWSGRGLDADDGPVLAYIIATSKTLTSLDVSSNDIRDPGADAIMEALKLSLAPLEAINVSGNQMSAPAKRALQHVAASVRGKMPSLSVQVED